MAAVFTTDGRIVLATATKALTAHLAWGTGNPAWGDNPPTPPVNTTALVAEVGRRQATLVEFCVPDPNGAISVTEGRFAVTSTPSPLIYLKFHFEFEEAVGSTIREMAIFIGTVAASGVPPGQFYLTPSQVANPGRTLLAERRAPIVRENTTRELLEYVVAF